MEGVSLRPAFAGQPLERKQPIFWEHEGNKAVRDGHWKLVQKWHGPWELYDIEADRTERPRSGRRASGAGRPPGKGLERLGRPGVRRRLARARSHELGAGYQAAEVRPSAAVYFRRRSPPRPRPTRMTPRLSRIAVPGSGTTLTSMTKLFELPVENESPKA